MYRTLYTTNIDRQVGPRTAKDREAFPPNNILLTLAGAGLVWMGWTGFNGGAPYSANIDASLAVVNTHLCAATSLLVWLCLDCLVFGRPSVIGAVQGMITGLVCITPAAGHHACIMRRFSRFLVKNFTSSTSIDRSGFRPGRRYIRTYVRTHAFVYLPPWLRTCAMNVTAWCSLARSLAG